MNRLLSARKIYSVFAYTIPLLASACTSTGGVSILGYSSDSNYDTSIHTVRVPVFRNLTFYRGIEFQLTRAVIQKIEARTPWKVVQQGYADAELLGTITQLQKRIPLVNPLNEVREGEYTMTVEVSFRDLRIGTGIPEPLSPSEPTPSEANSASSGKPPPKTLLIRSRPFVPELGQSTATARQQLVEDIAEQIVNMLESPW
jgi:hypothetical protein